jgi:hypothetical protein
LVKEKEARDWAKVGPSATAKFYVITSRGYHAPPSVASLVVVV